MAEDSVKKLAELKAKKNIEDSSSFNNMVAPVAGAIMLKKGLTLASGKPVATMDDVVEYVKENKPLFHSTSKNRAENIHKLGLLPEMEGGAIESYGFAPSQIKDYTEDELAELVPDVVRNQDYEPVSWMADKPSLGYSASSISKEKTGTASIGKATAEQLRKQAGINIIPRSEDIYWNKPNDMGGLDLRKSTEVDTPFRNYSEALDRNPFIESGDFISAEKQVPNITLTEDDAIDFIKRSYPEDNTYKSVFSKIADKVKKNKKIASAIPLIGPAIGAGLAAMSGEANAASAIPILGEADSLGPEQGSEDYAIENPQANQELRRKALESLLKK
jgi:hypothetical protein